jgi:acyl-CoA thioesterase I
MERMVSNTSTIFKTLRFILLSLAVSLGASTIFRVVSPLTGSLNFLDAFATDGGKKSLTKTILFFGDSLTAGYGLDPSEAFPARIGEKIASSGWNFEVINAGLSGETTAGGLRRIDWLLKRRVDVLVLALGANDGLRGVPVEVTRQNLQAIIDRAKSRYPDVKIVIAGMQIPPNLGLEYGSSFRSLFPDLARKNGASLIPFLLEGVGGRPELNLPDGIHPTPEGHKIIAENVWKILQPLLKSLETHLEPVGA